MSVSIASTPDPFLLNEYPVQGYPLGFGYNDITGRTEVSSLITDRPNTKIVIVDGQSEHATASGTGTYSTVSAQANNLNVYNGGIYLGADPVLGCSSAPSVGVSSVNMRIADRIIARGKATRVIMVPIAIGGTLWAAYEPTASGSLFTRFQAAYNRLAAKGLAPDAIIAARGVTDAGAGTSGASVRASINAWITGVRGLGCVAPIYLGIFTMAGGSVNATIQTAIANAVSDNSSNNVFTGYNGDTNATVAGGYRLADGTHLSNTGLTLVANGWADLIYP